MKNRDRILWITQTAAFTALLIVLQAATAPLGNALVTGSIVNMLLIISVMTGGRLSGLSVAVLSPAAAKFFGIGPLWSLIPFIVAGNIVLILLWHWIGNRKGGRGYLAQGLALVTAAAAKFFVLYFGIVKLAVPLLLKLPEPQAGVVSNLFSIHQLITASIGGAAALMILPVLKKAIKER